MTRWTIAVVVLGVFLATTFAEEPPKLAFKTALNLGATVTRGNSETMLVNASWLTEGLKEPVGALRAGAEANYGESTVDGKDDTTVDNAKFFAGAEKTLTHRVFAALNASVAYDNIADVDYRVILGPGIGAYLWRSESGKLKVEAGPSYMWEKVGGVRHDFAVLRAVERFEYQVSQTAKIWQLAEWLPRVEDFEDYLLNVEIGAEASVNARIKLRIVLQDKYDNTPPAGRESNDVTLIAGVGISL